MKIKICKQIPQNLIDDSLSNNGINIHAIFHINETRTSIQAANVFLTDTTCGKYKIGQRIKNPNAQVILDMMLPDLMTHTEYQKLQQDIELYEKAKHDKEMQEYENKIRLEDEAYKLVKQGDVQSLINYLQLCNGGEEGHGRADNALLIFIGNEKVTEAFDNIPDMWYA